MSYTAAIDQLNAMAPELHQPRRKFSLEQVRVLLQALGDPQRSFRSVLIAGTNGKGSTAATLASILTTAGLRTGLYTSPHLERPNERIRLDRAEIGDEAFSAGYFRVQAAAEQLMASGELPQPPSYFEVLTALAFLYFAEQQVEVAVLEVGMGGRLDATNVVEPLISIVTDISLDHTEWLGPTIAAIAREKAGILRANSTLITLPQHPEANQVLGEVATELGCQAVSAVPYMPPSHGAGGAYPVDVQGQTITVRSPLAGEHQHRNVALAIAAAAELATRYGMAITAAHVAEGIGSTQWPGRLERLQRGPLEWVLDVAHNPAGVWALRASLRALFGEEERGKALVFSCLRDKPAAEMAQILFPLFELVVLAPIHSARAASLQDLLQAAEAAGTPALTAGSVAEALRLAAERTGQGTIVVSGSVYLVGEARGLLVQEGKAP